ncbi:MAG: hypothetical protein WCQ21_35100 [Verrucomicrobiota bacterium]
MFESVGHFLAQQAKAQFKPQEGPEHLGGTDVVVLATLPDYVGLDRIKRNGNTTNDE